MKTIQPKGGLRLQQTTRGSCGKCAGAGQWGGEGNSEDRLPRKVCEVLSRAERMVQAGRRIGVKRKDL